MGDTPFIGEIVRGITTFGFATTHKIFYGQKPETGHSSFAIAF